MSKHTPGPWKQVESVLDGFTYLESKSGTLIAKMLYKWGNQPEHDGNTQLIAAAPDLLDACQEIINAWENMPGLVRIEHGNIFDSAVGMSREAIQKATD